MTIEIDAIKRILRDGVGLNRDTLAACLPELIAEIEMLRARVKELEYKTEAMS